MPANTRENSFLSFVYKSSSNLMYIAFGISISIAVWIIFKEYYPNPNVIFDSYYYIYAAYFNSSVSAWPVGYSKFLRLIGLLSHSIDIVLISQFIFLQLSFLYFFFSLKYLYKLGELASAILFVFLFLNPIYIYTCNLILSDALFLGLSLIWLVNLLWIIFRPAPYMIFTQAVLLLIVFTIRHSALYYPVIAGVAYLLSRQQVKYKVIGIALPGLLVAGFMLYTQHENKLIFGVDQFSPFQGWKVASNALYIYEHVPEKEVKPVPKRFEKLDNEVRNYYHSKHLPVSIHHPDPSWGSYYMFMYPSPLLTFRDKQFGQETTFLINPLTLSKLGPLYKEYGSYILKKYPFEYAKYFVLPNLKIYMMPYPEVYYDSINPFRVQQDTLGIVAGKWFGSFSVRAPQESITFRSQLFSQYFIVNTLTHILFVISFLVLMGFGIYNKIGVVYRRGILLVGILWLINLFFIVIASASLLRYQLFITIVEFTFLIIFVEIIFKSDSDHYPLLRKDNGQS